MSNQNKSKVGTLNLSIQFDLIIVLSDNSHLLVDLYRKWRYTIPVIEVRYH